MPQSRRRAKSQSLSGYEAQSATRNEAIAQAYASGGYSMQAIGDYYGLHYSGVSRLLACSSNNGTYISL